MVGQGPLRIRRRGLSGSVDTMARTATQAHFIAKNTSMAKQFTPNLHHDHIHEGDPIQEAYPKVHGSLHERDGLDLETAVGRIAERRGMTREAFEEFRAAIIHAAKEAL